MNKHKPTMLSGRPLLKCPMNRKPAIAPYQKAIQIQLDYQLAC
ncbi:hypothetical protein [Coleofasciculus sp.]